MFNDSHDVTVLNSLIETTIDSVDGYRHSAGEATNEQFAEIFRRRAQEREEIVGLLRRRVVELGGEPEEEGGLLAKAHRQFLSLRDAVTGRDDKAVVAEVDRGESYLNGKWEAALADTELSAATQRLLHQCYQSVRSGHDQWEQMNKAISAN
ncbi:MAG TPA: PA2169 family four-helix-bundle protein [Allosphingosinicella sp.]|nr:PA2169 family four-helix-bundle protein [Allosphingosinicella sp.]